MAVTFFFCFAFLIWPKTHCGQSVILNLRSSHVANFSIGFISLFFFFLKKRNRYNDAVIASPVGTKSDVFRSGVTSCPHLHGAANPPTCSFHSQVMCVPSRNEDVFPPHRPLQALLILSKLFFVYIYIYDSVVIALTKSLLQFYLCVTGY